MILSFFQMIPKHAWIESHLLSILIAGPLLSAILIALVPARATTLVKSLALLASFLTFLVSLLLLKTPETNLEAPSLFNHLEVYSWIPNWNVFYRVGVDTLAIAMVILSTVLFPIALLASWRLDRSVKGFFLLFLLLESAVIGAFVSLDLVLFYVFWEAMLIPMFMLIGIWGGKSRLKTSMKFFIFTFSGSLLLLIGILILGQVYNSFNLIDLYQAVLPINLQYLLFVLFSISFLIKVPAFPVHSWLPDTHTEAPTAGSVILAAVLLKLGVYGLLRFCLPLFGAAVLAWQTPLLILSATGIIYGSLLSWVQTDMKRLVAYSSIAHMGTILLGVFSLNEDAITGGIFHMISHGLTTGSLFLLIGMLYERTHTRELSHYGGVASKLPLLATAFLIATFGSIGLPGTNGFVGEFLILSGVFNVTPFFAILGASGVVLGAVYMLRLCQQIFFGTENKTSPVSHHLQSDVSWREGLLILPLLVMIIVFGILPSPVLKALEGPVHFVVERVKAVQDFQVKEAS